jgi:fatty acid desaturase
MGVPCYNLPLAHRLLGKGNYHQRMTIEPNYLSVIRRVTATQPA